MDATATPVHGVREFVGKSISVAPGVPDDEIIGDCANRGTALWNDHEVRIRVASLDFACGSNVFLDLVDVVGVTDHTDLRFVLEKTLDVSIEVGITEVIVEHPDW